MKKLLVLILLPIIHIFAYAAPNPVKCAPGPKLVNITHSVQWYRASAEKKALYIQTYNAASIYVHDWYNKNIKDRPKKSWGVILDIDETVLDNSWYFKLCSKLSTRDLYFNRSIGMLKKSTAIPGAINFITLVKELGGYVSLVSNRDGDYNKNGDSILQATVDNLNEQGIYFDQLVLANKSMATNPRDKNPRFRAIERGEPDATEMVWYNDPLPKHEIVAYLGDNIQDFPRLNQVDISKNNEDASKTFSKFGNGYFIMPNPIYGSWEEVIGNN